MCVDDVKTVTGEEVKELSRKNRLLSAHSLKCQDMVNVLNEFSKRIRYRVKVVRYKTPLHALQSHDYHMTVNTLAMS